MVAVDLGPVIHNIDIGFATVPRLRGGVPDKWVAETVLDFDLSQTTGKGIKIHAGNAESRAGRASVIGSQRNIAIVADTGTGFHNQGRRKDVGFVECATLLMLVAGSLESTIGRTAGQPKDRLL